MINETVLIISWIVMGISLITLGVFIFLWLRKQKGRVKDGFKKGIIEKHEWKNIAVMSIITFVTLTFFYSLKAIIVIHNPLLEGSAEGFIGGITFIIFTVLAIYIAQSRLDRGKTKR